MPMGVDCGAQITVVQLGQAGRALCRPAMLAAATVAALMVLLACADWY